MADKPLFDAISAAIQARQAAAKPFEHPQFIEGTLYLTRPQWNELAKSFRPPALTWSPYGEKALLGIPVRLVEAGESITLPSGKQLIWSAVMKDQFIIFDPKKAGTMTAETPTVAEQPANDICFMDTETMGLDEDAPIWEFAAIRRNATSGEETSLHIQIQHDPREWLPVMDEPFRADYLKRYTPEQAAAEHVAANAIYKFLYGSNIVGAVPSFDTVRIARLLERHGLVATTRARRLAFQVTHRPYRLPWHYHVNDVETMAIGWLHGVAARAIDEARMRGEEPHPKMLHRKLDPPWKSDELSIGLGVDPAQYARHTAMGDVLWVRAQYDVITGASHV